jgi:phosphoglycolate phosphatase
MSDRTTLLFDLDGTLTDNYAGISRSIRHALSALGAPVPASDALRTCVGPPLRGSFARFLATDDHVRIERALALYRERYAVEGWRENEVYAGVDAALGTLAARGHRMLLCTSKPTIYARQIVAHFGLAPYIERVYGAELDGRFDDKIELMGNLIAVEKLDPARCIMIGDRAQDMRAAIANGVDALGALWGYGSRDELVAAGARLLIDEPGDLVTALDPGSCVRRKSI